MARITVTTDDGTLVDMWSDGAEEIGLIREYSTGRAMLMFKIEDAVNKARVLDKRTPRGEEQK